MLHGCKGKRYTALRASGQSGCGLHGCVDTVCTLWDNVTAHNVCPVLFGTTSERKLQLGHIVSEKRPVPTLPPDSNGSPNDPRQLEDTKHVPSLISHMVSVDVKHHVHNTKRANTASAIVQINTASTVCGRQGRQSEQSCT